MRIFRLLSLVFLCVSLFAGGMANAAMPCCLQKATMSMQADGDQAGMPCHKEAVQKDTSKKESQSHNSCTKCTHCVSTTAVINTYAPVGLLLTRVIHNTYAVGFVSYTPEGIDSPPKYIS